MNFALTDFLVSLANPQVMAAYACDPEHVMSEAGLSDEQKQAIREGDLYRIRRLSAKEMADSLHARLLTKYYEEKDPRFSGRVEVGPTDIDDVTTETDHNIVQTHDLSEDIAELRSGYVFEPYYAHLFDNTLELRHENELVFVGTGIMGANHLTAEARSLITIADKVLYCVADLAIERQLLQLNPNAEDLYALYGDEKLRKETYEQMVTTILDALRSYKRVCVVYYGHPGIFVWPSYQAIRQARKEGYRAYMLPAVSSLDCLFADVGFDPSRHSCQIMEATDMLVRNRQPDTNAAVVLFQVGCVGDLGYNSRGYDGRNVPILAEYLSQIYGPEHEAIVYEASQYPVCKARIERIQIGDLPTARLSGITTLYIPPAGLPAVDEKMVHKLGLPELLRPTARQPIGNEANA